MKVEWLDRDRKTARLTRGFLWWKRTTFVHKNGYGWRFAATDNPCPVPLDRWLDRKRGAAQERDLPFGHDSEWAARSDIQPPQAIVVSTPE